MLEMFTKSTDDVSCAKGFEALPKSFVLSCGLGTNYLRQQQRRCNNAEPGQLPIKSSRQ